MHCPPIIVLRIIRDTTTSYVPRRLDQHEEIIFSSVYNHERTLITIITVLEYMHDEVSRNRKAELGIAK